MLTVYTVILGDYDNLRPPGLPTFVEPDVEYLCFSDEPHDCPPWRIVPCPRVTGSTARDNRIPKMLSHILVDADVSIYHDACLSLNCRPSELAAELGDADLALYRHPCRKSIQEEMEACKRVAIGYGPEMEEQVSSYTEAGIGAGLWAGGVLVRRRTDAVAKFNEIWWREFLKGCPRDQIALPFALRESGVRFKTIDADILQDPQRFGFCFHADFTAHHDNERFVEQRAKRKAKREHIEWLCR